VSATDDAGPELHALLASLASANGPDRGAAIARVAEWCCSRRLARAADRVLAAELLLTSEDRKDVQLAEAQALAVMRELPAARPLAAAAFDRLRVLDGRPQKFGTQRRCRNGLWELAPRDTATTDSERAKWGVPPLAVLEARLAEAVAADKAVLRLEQRRGRSALPPAERAAAAAAIATAGAAPIVARAAGLVVAAYWPVRSEADPRALAQAVAAAGGATLALPRLDADGMVFAAWSGVEHEADSELRAAAFGTREPTPHAPTVRPDVVLAPLLAFDAHGGRLGQGGGHYDRALAALGDVFVVGVAFASQEVAAVPRLAHDRLLDAVVTQRAYRAFRRSS
jgi:5-formyltetrahydrofolate cyclo-ligase